MKLVTFKRTIPVLCVAVALGAVYAQTGTAHAPVTKTLPPIYYGGDPRATFVVNDIPPKSPTENLTSPDYRFSIGDGVTFSTPAWDSADKAKRKQIGTMYVNGVVSVPNAGEGGNPSLFLYKNMKTLATTVWVFNNGDEITGTGVFGWGPDDVARPQIHSITGGTGAYKGARGTWSHTLMLDSISIQTLKKK